LLSYIVSTCYHRHIIIANIIIVNIIIANNNIINTNISNNQTSGLSTTYAEVQRAAGASERVLALTERTPGMKEPENQEQQPREEDENAGDADADWGDVAVEDGGAVENHGVVEVGGGDGGGLRVEFRDVAFTYPARPEAGPILENFNLIIEPGSVVGIQVKKKKKKKLNRTC
jgi:ABC-type multidrug transport system fused ATPase/permease subunit